MFYKSQKSKCREQKKGTENSKKDQVRYKGRSIRITDISVETMKARNWTDSLQVIEGQMSAQTTITQQNC